MTPEALHDIRTAESDLGLARCSLDRVMRAFPGQSGVELRAAAVIIDGLLAIVASARRRAETDWPCPVEARGAS